MPRIIVLAALVLVLACDADAQTTGTIAGTVRDAQTGSPLQAAIVSIQNSIGSSIETVPTSVSGTYSLGSLVPGSYFVYAKALATDYIAELFDSIPCVASDCVRTSGTPVSVTANATTTIDFALSKGGRITGTILRSDTGGPIVSPFIGTIAVFTEGTSPVTIAPISASETTGEYSVEGLPTGRYFVRASSRAPLMASLFGTSGLLSEVFNNVKCDFDSCLSALGTPVTVTAGATTAGIDFVLDPGGRITGTVRSGSSPTVYSVCAYAEAGVSAGCTLRVGADGAYEIRGLPTGAYKVKAGPDPFLGGVSDSKWYDDKCSSCSSEAKAVVVTAGMTTGGIDFVLNSPTNGAIEGTLDATGTMLLNPPSAAPGVRAYDPTGAFIAAVSFPTSVPGSQRFTYRIDALPPGTYYLRTGSAAFEGTRSSGGYFVDQLFDNIDCVAADCDVRRGTPVTVTPGATTRVDFRLLFGGQIRGSRPDAGIVEVYDSRGVLLPSRTLQPRDDSRSYAIVGLPDGVYYLRLVQAGSHAIPEQILGNPNCAQCAITSGTPVVVHRGETTSGVDFPESVGLAHTIAGTVRDVATSQPISTITVQILSPSGEVVNSSVTDMVGRYAVSVPSGMYYARTLNARGYVDERYQEIACGQCAITGSTPIDLTVTADATNIDFALSLGSFVLGTVTTSDGVAISNAPISFRSQSGTIAGRALTNHTGAFGPALPPGTYTAYTDSVPGFKRELYRELPCAGTMCDSGAGMPIVVGSATVTGIDFTLAACAPLTIAPLRLANAAVGISYRQVLSAAGGSGPFGFAITSGALPAGLSLDGATGVLSGTPTVSGRYTFTVAATDSAGCAGSREYTLDVPACAFNLALSEVSLRARGEPWLIEISNACGQWTATSNAPWIHVGTIDVTLGLVAIGADPNPGGPRTGTVTVGPRVFTVSQSGAVASDPFGAVDTPGDGVQVTGSIAISGWALDDLGVLRVLIYRDPVGSEGSNLVFVGQATMVPGARPDVEKAFPSAPFNRRAGWGYLLLTNMLPNRGNGIYRFYAFAVDADLRQALIGSRTIVGINDTATLPFGAIDTPAQGETISGASYINFGWALTPQPQTIPTNGSTIQVVIDGVVLGTITYNLFRPDVSTLFPNLNNSAGPVGYRVLDTTTLEEGLHTIAWLVTDDGGRSQGIGSRFFEVQNSAWTSLQASTEIAGTMGDGPMVPSFKSAVGVDLGRRAASLDDLPLGDDGVRTLAIRELERIELALAPQSPPACAPTYAGYAVAVGEMRELPVGSSLDNSTGAFAWQPGPGFVGRYDLLFVRTACDGTRERIPVRVTIR
jgi:hypothetical protein